MPISQIKVEIDGRHIANVLAVEYGLEVENDADGRPTDARPRLARICIRRRSDESQVLGDWACHPFAGHFKGGKVSFFDPQEETKIQSTMSWEKGWCSLYKEEVPHINDLRHRPMTEYVEISAQKIKVNDVEIDAHTWT